MADISQWIKVKRVPTSTPGVTTAKLDIDPNAPPGIKEAAASVQSAITSGLWGGGGPTPEQTYAQIERSYTQLVEQNPTLAVADGVTQPTNPQYVNPPIQETGQNVITPPVTGNAVATNPTPTNGTVNQNTPTWNDLLTSGSQQAATTTPAQNATPLTNISGQVLPNNSTPVTNPATGGPTPQEQAWIAKNAGLAQQLWGTTTPPAGKVAEYVRNWYAGNPGTQPDATDSAIMNPQGVTAAQTNVQPVPGGNYQQNQAGTQAGAYSNTGTTNTNQQQTSGGTSNQQQTGYNNTAGTTTNNQTTQQAQTGGLTQATTGNTATTNTGTTQQQQASTNTGVTDQTRTGLNTTTIQGTTRAEDTLGFGALLQGQQSGAVANDATRTNYLTDLVNTGGSAFGSQVDQAVRNSLSGPQMTGAGDSARARASGYAAAQIARNNTQERLNAASQLAGPSAVSTLSTAANPYIGQTTNGTSTQNINERTQGTTTDTGNTTATGTTQNTGNTATTGNTTGTSFSNLLGNTNATGSNIQTGTSGGTTTGSTTGFQNLIGSQNESSLGTATGSSNQSAAGLIPEAQQVSSGGGCVLCTTGIALGQFRTLRVLRRVIAHKLVRDPAPWSHAACGYFFIFTPIARFLLKYPRLAKFSTNLSKAVVYEELRISGRWLPFKSWPWIAHAIAHSLCTIVGHFPVPNKGVTDTVIADIAREHNVFFKFGGVK